jgi:hypothetical protein
MADLLIVGCPDGATAETAAAEVSMPPRTVAATGGPPSGVPATVRINAVGERP